MLKAQEIHRVQEIRPTPEKRREMLKVIAHPLTPLQIHRAQENIH